MIDEEKQRLSSEQLSNACLDCQDFIKNIKISCENCSINILQKRKKEERKKIGIKVKQRRLKNEKISKSDK